MSRRFVLLLMGVAGLVGGSAGVEASAIHHSDATAADVKMPEDWSKYLKGGPTVWAEEVHPPVTPAVVSEVWKDIKTDPGGTDPMIEFLLWKQSIDPTRFAYYHPKLAPALHRISLTRSSPTTTQAISPTTGSGGTTSPSTITPPPTTEPQNLIPSASPEPSTLLIAAGLAAWAAVQGRGRRRGG